MNAAERTRLETLDGRLVDAEVAITSAQETLSRVLNVVAASVVDEAQSAAAEPVTGEWVTVRPDDPRIVDGSRVRLGGVEGTASCLATSLACHVDVRSPSAWVVRNTSGPDVELWVPAEVTLPLPDGPGVFWGRVERDHETYVGWVLRAPVVSQLAFVSPVIIRGAFWHGSEHVTRLPVPDAELEALR